MRIPTYSDNKPANLQAAILDAMFWLRVLRKRLNDEPQLPLTEEREQQVYLRLAVEALQGFLPDEACLEAEAKQAKVNSIKANLRAKQQAMRATE